MLCKSKVVSSININLNKPSQRDLGTFWKTIINEKKGLRSNDGHSHCDSNKANNHHKHQHEWTIHVIVFRLWYVLSSKPETRERWKHTYQELGRLILYQRVNYMAYQPFPWKCPFRASSRRRMPNYCHNVQYIWKMKNVWFACTWLWRVHIYLVLMKKLCKIWYNNSNIRARVKKPQVIYLFVFATIHSLIFCTMRYGWNVLFLTPPGSCEMKLLPSVLFYSEKYNKRKWKILKLSQNFALAYITPETRW